jgi:hypothetical protein
LTDVPGYILGLNSGNRGADVTRPISQALYERICPPQERVYIDQASVEALRQLDPANNGTSLNDLSGKTILAAWLDRLNQPDTKDARCVEVRENTLQMFSFWQVFLCFKKKFNGCDDNQKNRITGTKQIHDLWDLVSNSPMITGWSWSPLIYEAFERYRHIISPTTSFSFFDFAGIFTKKKTDTLPLLALHIRRGDYAKHCTGMSGWGSTFTGQNSFPEFEEHDKFVIPQVVASNGSDLGSFTPPGDTPIVSSQDEVVKYYMKHCYPDIGQVVEKVRQVLHDYESFARSGRGGSQQKKYENWGLKKTPRSAGRRESVGNKLLKRIYIMSNGDRQMLRDLKQALMDDAESSKLSPAATTTTSTTNGGETTINGWEFEWTWEGVSTSRDLELGWEEKPVGQALDMYIGQRSELFIGNGVSIFI